LVLYSVTSCSTEHTFIDLFFENTCMQVIWLWYIMISFRLWVIYDDDDDDDDCDLLLFDVYVLEDAIDEFS
jgi:hypothetical protein